MRKQTASQDFQDMAEAVEYWLQDAEDASSDQSLTGRHNTRDAAVAQLAGRMLWQLVHVEGGRQVVEKMLRRPMD